MYFTLKCEFQPPAHNSCMSLQKRYELENIIDLCNRISLCDRTLSTIDNGSLLQVLLKYEGIDHFISRVGRGGGKGRWAQVWDAGHFLFLVELRFDFLPAKARCLFFSLSKESHLLFFFIILPVFSSFFSFSYFFSFFFRGSERGGVEGEVRR